MIDTDLKPVLSVFAMPTSIGLIAVGLGLWMALAAHAARWRRVALALGVTGLVTLWLGSTQIAAWWLQEQVIKPPAALTAAEVAALRVKAQDRSRGDTAIVVLGGGRQDQAAEYGSSMLTEVPLARLHYGIWLARNTGLPLAYSGGVGWAQSKGASEAQTAQLVATRDYKLPLRWIETSSRDTRENARLSVAMVRRDGIRRVVVVTHASHMRRAVRAFRQAGGPELEVIAAPMGFITVEDRWPLPWMPSAHGYRLVDAAWHEVLGLALNR
ncbi:MAG: hypothetical protein RL375_1918 [Pseudomonadota bacterium]|jgi:uncharacterized SAM-binding protein YcdF (DUF218 family)